MLSLNQIKSMNIKKIIALSAILSQCAPLGALAAADATISLSSPSTSVAVGSTFSVSVKINPGTATLDTARVTLYYPTNLLDVVSTQLGTQFSSELPGNAINESVGTLTIGGFSPTTEVTKEGTFATVTFKAVAAGSANIEPLSTSHLLADGYDQGNFAGYSDITINLSGSAVATDPTEVAEGELLNLDLSAQQRALGYFGAFTGRMPSSDEDWAAHRCMWYSSCAQDNAAQDAVSLDAFKKKFGRAPADPMENYVIDALTKYYTLFGLTKATVAATPTTPVTPEVAEYDAALAATFLALLPASPSDFSKWNPAVDLLPGDTSLDVAYLQRFLATRGASIYSEGYVTAYYGPLTKSAVLRYQAQKGITQTGNVGALTRAAILKDLGR